MQKLPVETQIEIIRFLDDRTLGKLYQVSKHFRNLILNEEDNRIKILKNKFQDYVLSLSSTSGNRISENDIHNLDDCLTEFINRIKRTDPSVNYLKLHHIFSKGIFNFHEKKRGSLIKLLILGESGVGKTSLHNKFLNNQMRVTATIGWGFAARTLQIGQTSVCIHPWDTAGQERFQSLGVAFYRGVDVVMYVIDVTSQNSLPKLRHWMEECKQQCQADPLAILVANKMDRPRVLSEKQVQDFAKEHHLAYIETSAKTGINVELLFRFVALLGGMDIRPDDIPIFGEPQQQSWCLLL